MLDKPDPRLTRCSALVAPGGLHSVAVSGSGQILTWGANQNGLLGLGSSAQQNVPTPTPVPDVFAAHVSSSLVISHITMSLILAADCQ